MGGGLRLGQLIGATNARGEHPVRRALDINCLLATIYSPFGIDYSQTLSNRSGRAIHILPAGEVIRELVGG
ncbi:MAG: DUF1501 domain-containing protein [Gemmataceae bacterium]|nr:DUF1501 domain-containing protein [Gemmataceae bacterium]